MFLQILKYFTVVTQCVWRLKWCVDATQRDDRDVEVCKTQSLFQQVTWHLLNCTLSIFMYRSG